MNMRAGGAPQECRESIRCPECAEEVWDVARGHRLHKCWNSEGHKHGAPLAFDAPLDSEVVA